MDAVSNAASRPPGTPSPQTNFVAYAAAKTPQSCGVLGTRDVHGNPIPIPCSGKPKSHQIVFPTTALPRFTATVTAQYFVVDGKRRCPMSHIVTFLLYRLRCFSVGVRVLSRLLQKRRNVARSTNAAAVVPSDLCQSVSTYPSLRSLHNCCGGRARTPYISSNGVFLVETCTLTQ